MNRKPIDLDKELEVYAARQPEMLGALALKLDGLMKAYTKTQTEMLGAAAVLSTEDLVDELFRRGIAKTDLNIGEQEALLAKISSAVMLEELAHRGGHPGALAEAALLCLRKSRDYNHGKDVDPHKVDRSNYFPLGLASHAQMLHTKTERLLSLARKGGGAIFESARDTCLDLINYGGFAADFLASEKAKES